VRSYITRRQHHASLLCWCGGNELQGAPDGGKLGTGKPVTLDHPLIAMMAAAAAELDQHRRFLPTSASGPRFNADAAEFGCGVHWDVHGPWWPASDDYWDQDDVLFRSEVGAAGASPLDLLEQHYAPRSLLPLDDSNPLWRRFGFWIQEANFRRDHDRDPRDLAEFVAWSQEYQRTALVRAARACKRRFPACGGFIVWMGHDTFPCPANTAVLDFLGRPKPAALGLGEIFLVDAKRL
jgi:beta-mannosidase